MFEEDRLANIVALSESSEFGDLLPFSKSCEPACFSRKLPHVLSGPVLPTEEDFNSNQARNVLFELNLASKLWKAGLDPELGEHPDLMCEIGGVRLLIECKRPLTANGARQSVKYARKQLVRLLYKEPAGSRGVVALSLTKLMNLGDKLYVYQTEAKARDDLSRRLQCATEALNINWRELEKKKVVGILCHVITPAVDESVPLYVVAQHTNAHPVDSRASLGCKAFERLFDSLDRVFGENRGN